MVDQHETEKYSLVDASYHGLYDTVRQLVRNLPSTKLDETATVRFGSNESDLHNSTALHVASINGFADIAKLLLESGASHNIRDCTGATPFSEAVYHNQLQLVDVLAQFGADVDSVNSFGWTPLHVAAFQGKLEMVKRLLELGADSAALTPEGYTVLHLAAQTGRSGIVAYLLAKGIPTSFPDVDHTPCPLFLAVAGHFKSLVNQFLQHPDCPLSCKADTMMLTGAVDVLDSRVAQAKLKWFNALQLREDRGITFAPSPHVEYGNRCEIADLAKHGELFESDAVEIEAAYQSAMIWERCMGAVDQRYWVCLRHLTEKLVRSKRYEEAGKVIHKGMKSVESSQLPLLEKGCILPQNFEVFFGDTIQLMVLPCLAKRIVTFESTVPFILKMLDVLISRAAFLCNTFGCANFVPKFLLGIILEVVELWLTVDLTPGEYESREQFGRNFVSNYLYLSDGSNLLFVLLYSSCQNKVKLCEALLCWGAVEAINSCFNGQRLFQAVFKFETLLYHALAPTQIKLLSPLLNVLVNYGVHGDAVDCSGKSAIKCCPDLFGPTCPLPLSCLVARKIIQYNLPYQNMDSVSPRLRNFVMMHDVRAHRLNKL